MLNIEPGLSWLGSFYLLWSSTLYFLYTASVINLCLANSLVYAKLPQRGEYTSINVIQYHKSGGGISAYSCTYAVNATYGSGWWAYGQTGDYYIIAEPGTYIVRYGKDSSSSPSYVLVAWGNNAG